MSTYLNSLAGTMYTDFIKPHMPEKTTEQTSSNVMKLLVVINGIICVSLVFIVDKLGAVLELSIRFGGMTAGTLLGLFTLGMLFPSANIKVRGYQTLESSS